MRCFRRIFWISSQVESLESDWIRPKIKKHIRLRLTMSKWHSGDIHRWYVSGATLQMHRKHLRWVYRCVSVSYYGVYELIYKDNFKKNFHQKWPRHLVCCISIDAIQQLQPSIRKWADFVWRAVWFWVRCLWAYITQENETTIQQNSEFIRRKL